jgi:hypothetical protein
MSTFAAPSPAFDNLAAAAPQEQRRQARRTRLSAPEVLVLAILLALLLASAMVARHPAGHDVRSTSVRVESGQTLWDLAKSHPVAGMSTDQTAELIAGLNDLGTRGLVAHMVVRVPATTPSDVLASR